MLGYIVVAFYVLGLIVIIAYAISTNGRHFKYVGVGVVTAFAASLTGCLFGFILGIPRAVSSGAVRQEGSTASDPTAPTPTRAARFAQSTNLAEISDWLTKLLLGAGLVSLTKLGRPIGALIHAVAGGFVSGTVTGSAKVMSGGIMITYVVLGFLVAYICTTVWYRKILDEVY
jgi:hypothetical protein